jgi:hypothetical protein
LDIFVGFYLDSDIIFKNVTRGMHQSIVVEFGQLGHTCQAGVVVVEQPGFLLYFVHR